MENKIVQTKLLEFVLLSRKDLKENKINRMYELMEKSYDHMNYEAFLSDLSNKDFVGLLFDQKQTIQGFTTFAINPKGIGTDEYSIIFSGDTIISPDYWGTQEMIRGWGISVGKIMSTEVTKKWYWLLLSKGHRTYMYLPLFFNQYYPSIYTEGPSELKSIIDVVAPKLYSGYYRAENGVLVFDKKFGELKPALAQATFEKKDKPHVKLFLEKNPGFYKGDELVCLAPLQPDNLRGYGKKFILEGLKQKHYFDNEV